MSSGLADQKTTPSLTDFRCWPPTSDGPNYHHQQYQFCIPDNCSGGFYDLLVLLVALTALRLKVSQRLHMTWPAGARMILHELGIKLSDFHSLVLIVILWLWDKYIKLATYISLRRHWCKCSVWDCNEHNIFSLHPAGWGHHMKKYTVLEV